MCAHRNIDKMLQIKKLIQLSACISFSWKKEREKTVQLLHLMLEYRWRWILDYIMIFFNLQTRKRKFCIRAKPFLDLYISYSRRIKTIDLFLFVFFFCFFVSNEESILNIFFQSLQFTWIQFRSLIEITLHGYILIVKSFI